MALELAMDRATDHAGSGPVLIAGAGIGGLAAAIGLAAVGCHVRVLESRRHPSEEGAGIQIGPNGVHALRQLGVADRLEPYVGRPKAIALMDAASGRCLTRLPLIPHMEQTHGAPYWVTRRADLHQALLSTARSLAGIEIVHGFRVETVARTVDGVRIGTADGHKMHGAALVGADGVWSTVARAVFGAPAVRFAHKSAARVVVPMAGMPAPFCEPSTGLWLGAKAHLVHYPLPAPRLDGTHQGPMVNMVAIVDGGAHVQDWGAPLETRALLPAFDGWPRPVREVLAEAQGWRRWSLMERPPLARWSDGPVTLLGDAAHPVLPFLAQGAVLALEDAVTLAAAVAAMPHDLTAAFRTYAGARRSRARRVANASRRNGRIYHLTGWAARARDTTLSWVPPERLIAGYDWLYGYRCPEFIGARV